MVKKKQNQVNDAGAACAIASGSPGTCCTVLDSVGEGIFTVDMDHSFPGNIRELANIIEYAYISCKDHLIGLEHLPPDLLDAFNQEIEPGPDRTSFFENPETGKIRSVLDRCKSNRIEAAKALGMRRTTLWRKMKKYGLAD